MIMKRTITILLVLLIFAACKKDDVNLSPNDLSSAENLNRPDMAKRSRKAPKTPKAPAASTLSFSGYTWTISDSGTGTQGPGPNQFSSSNAYVDANGYLHLELTKNTTTKAWQCASVELNQSLGYGTYQWQVEGRIDQLDPNVVFAMFNYSGVDGYDEMDIEYSKWGNAKNKTNLDFNLYPARGSKTTNSEATASVTLTQTYTTHRLIRSANEVDFQSLAGFQDDNTNLYASKSFYSPPTSISTLSMPVYMNLWLYQGAAPANGKNVEVIVHNFKFTPAASNSLL
jgi:hypothetical protein